MVCSKIFQTIMLASNVLSLKLFFKSRQYLRLEFFCYAFLIYL